MNADFPHQLRLLDNFRPATASTTYRTGINAPAWRARRGILVVVRSTCNQALTVQAAGYTRERPAVGDEFALGSSQSLAAGNTAEAVASFGVALDDGNDFPFIGLTILTGGTPPTTGFVNVEAYWSEHQNHVEV